MNSLFSILAISLVVSVSEACFPIKPPTPTTTTTKTTPKTTQTTASSTTTMQYKCPIGGEKGTGSTCVTGDNLIKTVASPNPEDCNKQCKDTPNSECKFWTFVPTRKLCFLLKSCTVKEQVGSVSGELGCIVPSKSFTLFNLINSEITDCEVKWEPTDICPPVKAGKTGDGKIPALGNFAFTYFTAPPSLACTKLTEVTCKMGAEVCKTAKGMDIPPDVPNMYVKTDLADPKKCLVDSTPKILG